MKESTRSPAFGGISILCIDNHIDSLEMLRVTLQLEGATVLTAASSREALFTLKQSSVDVVLCDLRMPDENGVEVLHKLRAAGFEGPAIALTAIKNSDVETEVFTITACCVQRLMQQVEMPFEAVVRRPAAGQPSIA